MAETCEYPMDGGVKMAELPKQISLAERLKTQEIQLTKQLEELRLAQKILEEHPHIEQLMSILGRNARHLL